MRSKRKKRRLVHRSVRNAGIAALSLSIVSGCSIVGAIRDQEAARAEVEMVKTVKVETVAEQRIEEPIQWMADIFSSVQMDIVAGTGGKAVQVLKRLGDQVEEGETIAILSSQEATLARDQAAAAVQQAKDDLQAAKQKVANNRKSMGVEVKKMELTFTDLTRKRNKLKNNYDSGLVSKEQLEEAEVQLEAQRIDLELAKQELRSLNSADAVASAETRVKDAELALQEAEEALAQLDVKAPVSGLITGMSLMEGAAVNAGASIGRVDKVDPVRIIAHLSEEAAGFVRGKRELIYMLPGEERRQAAPIAYLASVMDPKTKAYELSLEVPNADARLKPGLKVSIQLTEDEEQIAVGLPQYSILGEGEDRYVFVLQGDTVEKRAVKLGRSNTYYYEVLSGVQLGEKIVVTGHVGLQDQEKVNSVENKAAEATP